MGWVQTVETHVEGSIYHSPVSKHTRRVCRHHPQLSLEPFHLRKPELGTCPARALPALASAFHLWVPYLRGMTVFLRMT